MADIERVVFGSPESGVAEPVDNELALAGAVWDPEDSLADGVNYADDEGSINGRCGPGTCITWPERRVLTRRLLEVRAGVFVGTCSGMVRERLWRQIERGLGDGAGVLAHSADNEQGLVVNVLGDPTYLIEDFEGLQLVRGVEEVPKLSVVPTRVGVNRGRWCRPVHPSRRPHARGGEPSYFYAQFHRIARRRGRNKAAIAVAHSILTAVYHVLRTGQPYTDLGVEYFDRFDASRTERHHIRRLEQLGYSVTLSPSPA